MSNDSLNTLPVITPVVRLRVVGLYYRLDVPLTIYTPDSKTTVLDLLNAATAIDNNLTVNFAQDGSVSTISYNWPTKPPSLSGKPRAAGFYSISENLNGNQVSAWQYYIERPLPADPNYRTLVSKTRISGGFTVPGKSQPLLPGDEVIFRCVAIVIQPNLPFNPTQPSVASLPSVASVSSTASAASQATTAFSVSQASQA
jgi:hypothetical protein